MDAAHRILAALGPDARSLAVETGMVAARLGARAYLVGGVVRDALIGRTRTDVDVLVETPRREAIAWVLRALERERGGRVHVHPAFGTGVLDVDGLHLDVAMARSERYAHPGALPDVHPSDVRTDLGRRDFRCNALAVALPPAHPALFDPVGGLADLADARLRSIHPDSLRDDPTRVARGARLVARLGLHFDPSVAREVRRHLRPDVVRRVAHERRRHELELSLAEPRPGAVIDVLADIGALEPMFDLRPGPELHRALTRLDVARGVEDPFEVPERQGPHGTDSDGRPDRNAYLLVLAALGATHPARWLEVFGFPSALGPRAVALPRTAAGLAAADDADAGPIWERATGDERRALRALVPAQRELFDRIEGRDDHGDARRVVRGRDLRAAGVPAGPAIGRVLTEVARRRAAGDVTTYADELALALELAGVPPQGGPAA